MLAWLRDGVASSEVRNVNKNPRSSTVLPPSWVSAHLRRWHVPAQTGRSAVCWACCRKSWTNRSCDGARGLAASPFLCNSGNPARQSKNPVHPAAHQCCTCPMVVTCPPRCCTQEQQAPGGLTPSHSNVRGRAYDAVVPLFDRNPFVGDDGPTDGPARSESTATGEQPCTHGREASHCSTQHGHVSATCV